MTILQIGYLEKEYSRKKSVLISEMRELAEVLERNANRLEEREILNIGLGISSLDAASRINVLIGEASSLKDTYNALLQLAVREPENKPHAVGDIAWFWKFDKLESAAIKSLRPDGAIRCAGDTYGGAFYATRTAAIEARIAEEESEAERAREELAAIGKRVLELEETLEAE